jgi:hypothetical protein
MGKSNIDWVSTRDNAKELTEWLANFPYTKVVDYLGLGVMTDPRTEWCRSTFGQEYKRWTVNRTNDSDRSMIFYFSKESDLTLFVLRWG